MRPQSEIFKVTETGRNHQSRNLKCPACVEHDNISYPVLHADYSAVPVLGTRLTNCTGLMHIEIIDGPRGSQEIKRRCDQCKEED